MVVVQSGVQPGVAAGGLVAAGVGAWALVLAYRSTVRLLAMLRADERRVADVRSGLVEVTGTVVSAGETVASRMSDREAVVTKYNESSSSHRGRSGNERSRSLPLPTAVAPDLLTQTAAVPFYVDDGSGRVLVDAMQADVSLSTDTKEREVASGKERTEVEARLEPGDEVHVLGEAVAASRYTPPERGLRETVVALLTRSVNQTPASAVLDGEELVVTRGDGVFVVSDASGWRGWLRHGLGALFWALFGLGALAFGVFLVADAIGVALPV